MTAWRKYLNITAWIILAISMLLPMERHTLPGPCTWPCVYPFTYTVLDNTILFILAPFLVPIYLISDLTTAGIFIVYSFIGLGELLIFFLPLLDSKFGKIAARYVFAVSIVCVFALISYALIPSLRVGVDALLKGYYSLTASFLLMAMSRVIRLVDDK